MKPSPVDILLVDDRMDSLILMEAALRDIPNLNLPVIYFLRGW